MKLTRSLIECWEIPHLQRNDAARRDYRLGTYQRATSVTVAGLPMDPPLPGALLWRRAGSEGEGQAWLAGERAPRAPWADRATLRRVATGYVYEDPDLSGLWYATRKGRPHPTARDEGPFGDRRAAALSLIGARQTSGAAARGRHTIEAATLPSDVSRERASEAITRAPLPDELLDEARAGGGEAALLRAWPEAARLPLEPAARQQAITRIGTLPQIEDIDPDAASREAASVITELTGLLREWDGVDAATPRAPRNVWVTKAGAGMRVLIRRAGALARRPGVTSERPRVVRSRSMKPGRRPGDRPPGEVASAFGEGEGVSAEGGAPAAWVTSSGYAGPERRRPPPVAGQTGSRGWYQLEERHLALQVARLATVAALAAAALLWFEPAVSVSETDLVLVTAVALVVQLSLLVVPLWWPNFLRLAVDVSLVADAAWVTGVAVASGSSESPLVSLFLLTSLTAALGYSGRTGVRAAILATLGYLGLAWHSGEHVWSEEAATHLLVLWAIVSIAAAGAAVGQRELRLRAERLGILQQANSDMLATSNPATLAEVTRTAAEQILPGWQVTTRRGDGPDAIRLARDGSEAVVAVPVTNGSTSLGVIECRRPRRRAGTSTVSVRARDLACLSDLGASLGIALSRSEFVDALSRASATDPLTDLSNRRTFDAALARELAGVRRHGRPLSLCFLDVDHFKDFNDSFGHLAGDRALQLVAGALRSESRGTDVAARYGGEEFALLLPDTGLDAALLVAERVRSTVASLAMPGRPITVSIGVAVTGTPCFPEELIGAADEALYAAKERGRNRVEASDASPPMSS